MKKRNTSVRLYFITLLSIVIISTFVSAAITDEDQEKQKDFSSGTLSVDDYKSSDAYPSIFTNKATDWSLVDWSVAKEYQNNVPLEHIKDIPAQYVDVTKVRDQSMLTSDHLSYNDNINRVSDWSKLHQNARDSVLSSRAGKPVVLDTGGQSVSGSVTKNGFKINQGSFLQYENFAVTGFKNVEVIDGVLKAESGKEHLQVENGEKKTSTRNFQELSYNTKNKDVKVQSAALLSTKNGDVYNIKKSTLQQTSNGATILFEEAQTTTLVTGTQSQTVKAEAGASLTLSPSSLTASKIELSFGSSLKFSDSVDGTASNDVRCSSCSRKSVSFGSCWTLSDDSSYTFSTIGTSIEMKTPDSLCIVDKPYSCNDCSVFNTNDRTIKTKSAILNIEKKLNGFDDFTARTSGDAEYSLSEQFALIESLDVFDSSLDVSVSKYMKFKKGDSWLVTLEHVEKDVREQVKSIIDGVASIKFDSGNATAINKDGEQTILHKPQDVPTIPEKLLMVPLLLPILFFLPRKGQVSSFIILGIITIIIIATIIYITQNGLAVANIPEGSKIKSAFDSCVDTSMTQVELALSKQGRVPLKDSDEFLNVSLFLKGGSNNQPSIDEARAETEKEGTLLYARCIQESLKDIATVEQNPELKIEWTDQGTSYYVYPNAQVTVGSGDTITLKNVIPTMTSYPYKKFHEKTRNMIEMISSTGYMPLYNGNTTNFWSVKGKTYVQLQDENENYYQFALELK